MKRKKLTKAISLLLAMTLVAGGKFGTIGNIVLAKDSDESVTFEQIQAEFFVSPDGNDQNPGTYENPFASLEGAREAVSKINQDMSGDIYVFLMPGTYYVTETVNFDAEDSGSNGHKIIYKCFGEPSDVKLLGGIKVHSKWETVKANTNPKQADSDLQQELVGKVYKTNLKGQLDETFGVENWPATSGPLPLDKNGKFTVNTISVNDTRATLARTLNSDKFEGMPATLLENPLYTAGGSYMDVTVRKEDFSKLSFHALENAEKRGDLSAQIVCNDIGGKRAWDSNTLPITHVDSQNGKFIFNPDDTGDFAPLYAVGGDSRYYMQGNLAFLDTPGEFYYNPETYDLYYYPKAGEEELDSQEIIVPTTDKIVNLEGERIGVGVDTKVTPVHNIVFDGLKFADTSFPDFYSSGYPWLPYASGTPSKYAFPEWAKTSSNPIYCGASERPQFQVGTINLKYTDQITIQNCQVKNAGMNGIEMYLGVTNTMVDNSLVEYCANGGIMIEGGFPGIDGNSEAVSYTNNNVVKNTVVHDVGQMVHQSFGIQVANATYNTIENCEVYHSPRRGILLLGSDIGSWNNTGTGNRNWSSVPYDVKRDEYTHHNKFSNIYLHDVQQDGGDDGGLFAVFIYYNNSENFSRPNYFDQIVINEVGANPNMSDIAPNNINLDMGWLGIEMSNIKTVNAQHYSIENSNLQNGQVKVDNCSFFFKNEKDGVNKFDDSKMDYANIGVQSWQYPDTYKETITDTKTERPEHLYFEEDFETGINLNKWNYSGNIPITTKLYMSEGPFNGKEALAIDNTIGGENTVLYRTFEEDLNKVVTVNIFDRQLSPGCDYSGHGKKLPDTGRTTVRVDTGTDKEIIALGIDPEVDRNHYVINVGGEITSTSVRRVFGWHKMEFDYSEAGKVSLYIDGIEVGTASSESFNYIALGSTNDTGGNFYDQLYVFDKKNSIETAEIQVKTKTKVISNAKEQKVTKTYVDWKFEDESDYPYDKDETYQTPFKQIVSSGDKCNEIPAGNTMVDYFNTTLSVVDNPVKNDENQSDKVLARSGKGGCQGYAQQDIKWSNYVWSADYLYKSSAEAAKDNCVNIILNSQNENDTLNTGYPYQPIGYWFSINEGTSALELKKAHAQTGSKTELAKVQLDSDEFAREFKSEDKWHNIKFYVKNGEGYVDIRVSVDNGKYVLEGRDASAPYMKGTFAFNSMGTDYYMDNILISEIAESPIKGYDTNFKIGNATLDKAFNYDVTDYTAVIENNKQDVTFVKPDGQGAEYTISLNGEDITEKFSDTVTAVALPLKPGNNTLTVAEVTEQQIKTVYKVEIYKECTLVSTDIPDILEVNVGEMPQFPGTTTAVVNDGQQNLEMTSEVCWELVDQSYYKVPGEFVVKGKLTEIEEGAVNVIVKVEGIKSVDELTTIYGKVGQNPAELLPETIGVNYEYAGKQQKPVLFKSFGTEVYAHEGIIVAVGSVAGYNRDVLQVIELEDSFVIANKEVLQKTYDYAKTINTDGATESAKKFLEKALVQAEEVLNDSKAIQTEVDAACNDLFKAIWGIGVVQGDKTNLKLLLDRADVMMTEADRYVQKNWNIFVDALEAARKVYDSQDSTPDIVEEAADELLNAILIQRYKANKENLQNILEQLESLDFSKYTKESVEILKKVWKDAKEMMADENLSTDDQKKVDQTVNELKNAINELKLVPMEEEGNIEAGVVPKTGDTMNEVIWIMLMLSAIIVLDTVLCRKREG